MLANVSGLKSLSLTAPVLRIHYFERPILEARTPVVVYQQPDKVQTWSRLVYDAHVTLESTEEKGYVALLVDDESHGAAMLEGSARLAVEPRDRTSMQSAHDLRLSTKTTNATNEEHVQIVEGHHVAGKGPGRLAYEGTGMLKLRGPDIVVNSPQGRFHVPTGVERNATQAVQEARIRWVILEFGGAVWEAEATTAWSTAARRFDASWEGIAMFTLMAGELRGADTRYVAKGGSAQLAGDLRAILAAVAEADSTLLMRLDVSGDVASTTLQAAAMLPRRGPSLWPTLGWALGGIVAVCALSAGFGWALRQRRDALLGPLTAEDCMEAANAAASVGDWPEAAEWFSRARRLAPGSARACGDLAFALSQIGDHEASLRLFAEASRLSSDGEADLSGALVALQAGRPPEEVERWVARCLSRSPEMVHYLEEDEEFAPLRGRPAFDAAVARAWSRADADGTRWG